MKFFFSFFVVILFTFTTSCNVSPNNEKINSFNLKSDIITISSAEPQKNILLNKIPDENISRTKVFRNNVENQVPKNVTFEDFPLDGENQDGVISVIYWNNKKIKIDNKNKYIKSLDNESSLLLNNTLEKYKISGMTDNAFPNVSEEELDNIQKKSSQMSESEIPHAHSIHTYHFPKGTDTKKICQELRELSFVRTAYPSKMLKTLTTVSQPLETPQSNSTIYHNPPGDNYFSSSYGESFWWWYNRHKIFHGHDLYGNTQMPSIAIVDSGFDISPNAYDRPSYVLPGTSVKYNNGWYIGNDVQEYSSDHPGSTFSHGTAVASIAGSPKNNFTYSPDPPEKGGLCGIAPGASIYPIKISGDTNEQAVAHAIFQASYTNADVINVSIGTFDNKPISYIPSIRNEIYNAYSVRGKIVVISAGNDKNVEVSDSQYSFPDSGEIIVGGTENQSVGKSKAWVSGIGGSTYGNRIHLSAGASYIGFQSYNPSSGSRTLIYDNGNSLSAPMVAAAAGMVKKFAQYNGNYNITPLQIRSILIFSSNLATYNGVPNPLRVEKFIGYSLSSSLNNVDRVNGGSPTANVRELNLYNALLLAKNSHQYNVISRVFNIDDYVEASINYNWNSYYSLRSYGEDAFYGINDLNYGDNLSYSNYNSGGGRSFGYQVYKNGMNYFEYLGGVNGVSGAYNGNSGTGWYDTVVYQNY